MMANPGANGCGTPGGVPICRLPNPLRLNDRSGVLGCAVNCASANRAVVRPTQSMANSQSVTQWIQGLKGGDEQAANELWQRYFQRMAALARQRLGEGQRRVQDEDDIAVSVFKSLCERAQRGDLAGLAGRDELWRLLATITLRKVAGQIRDATRQKRGGGQVRGDSVFPGDDGLDGVVGAEPTPEFLHQLAEEHRRLLDALDDDTLRRIALWKLEGWTGQEMAAKLGLTRRSVERKLERIRELWKGELNA